MPMTPSQRFAAQDPARYRAIAAQSRDGLFSDALPSGASGERLMAMSITSSGRCV